MSDKPKPVDDLKEGLGLLFRAAKGAVDNLNVPTEKIETVAKDAAKEMGRAFESIGSEVEKLVNKATGSQPPQGPAPNAPAAEAQAQDPNAAEAKKDEDPPKDPPKYDDGYAPEAPKGPRIG